MSRIGKQPVILPEKVNATVDGRTVTVTGPKGSLTQTFNEAVTIKLGDVEGQRALTVEVANADLVNERAQWGTARAIIANMVEGVVNGFTKTLEVNGVGYRVSLSGKKLVLTLGFTHDINVDVPEGITATVDKNVITITGADRQMVGELAASVRALKKPEPYKGKGVKYADEVIRRKAGKAAKAGE
jgi:large subunit ribosomal protein L6